MQIKLKGLSIAILLVIFVIPCWAQQVLSCGQGKYKYACGETWYYTYNGVKYKCKCNCAKAGPLCAPVTSSSSSSSSSGSNSGYNPQTQMAHDILQPVVNNIVNNFNNWLNSGPSLSQLKKQEERAAKKQEEERKQAFEAYTKRVSEQITNAQAAYKEMMAAQTQGQKEEIVNELKDRFAQSEAVKTVKQKNCDAYNSLIAAQKSLKGFNDFKDFSDFKNLDGPAEELRQAAQFTKGDSSNCPEIKISIPEVTAAQPVGFQELFYNYIVEQADSIKDVLDTLKVEKVNNDKTIEEKKQKIKEANELVEKQKIAKVSNTSTNQEQDNQLTNEALKELEAATKELQTAEDLNAKMKEEIELKEKNVIALKKLRSNYDLQKNETTPK